MNPSSVINVISVDVGTTSVRLAIVAFHGEDLKQARVLASQDKDINYLQDGDKFEQNSEEIFSAICHCSKECLKKAEIDPDSIRSIGFSATCSLVVKERDANTNDVIMWMDHRAIQEAQAITQSQPDVLKQFGGICSPEFSLSKLVWLSKHAKERLQSADGLFELPDWLVYRCIGGSPARAPRSLCSLTCKWGYDAGSNQHCDILKHLEDPGLADALAAKVLKPGIVSGFMSLKVATELGLRCGQKSALTSDAPTTIAVGTSLIDAHAGMLAMLSIPLNEYGDGLTVETTFCSLAGTSSCHMLLSKNYNFTKGIWGPYKNVVLDNYYLLEAGQSLTGKLVEICIKESQDGKSMLDNGKSMKAIIQNLNEQIGQSQPKSSLHILPTYHGNRSPLANPRLRGGVYGLSARRTSLLESYIAHIEAIAFETRLIVEALGIKLNCILVSGGLMKNGFYMQTLANILDCKVVRISLQDIDVMVMGSALVARCAALNSEGLNSGNAKQDSLTEFNIQGMIYEKLDLKTYKPLVQSKKYLEQKYVCYKEFVKFSQRVDDISRVD